MVTGFVDFGELQRQGHFPFNVVLFSFKEGTNYATFSRGGDLLSVDH